MGDRDCSLSPSDDGRDVYDPLDMADTWLILRCVKVRKDWGGCCCVVSIPAVGIPAMDRKGGSCFVGPVVV